MKRNNKQKGFTIIELVVVILLLGILTATALPRFMDVTDDAHGAVVNGVKTGLGTGAALFKAQWYAEGQPLTSDVSEFDLTGNADGYPIGENEAADDATDADGTECLAIYNSLLQAGRPAATNATWSGTAADLEDNVEAAAAGMDFVVTGNHATEPTACNFYYVGQFDEGTDDVSANIPTLTYTFSTGVVSGPTVTVFDQP